MVFPGKIKIKDNIEAGEKHLHTPDSLFRHVRIDEIFQIVDNK